MADGQAAGPPSATGRARSRWAAGRPGGDPRSKGDEPRCKGAVSKDEGDDPRHKGEVLMSKGASLMDKGASLTGKEEVLMDKGASLMDKGASLIIRK